MNKNVSVIAKENLCISCGVCKSICPKNAISYKALNGMYVPAIEEELCVNCGLCYEFCPGKGCDYSKLYGQIKSEIPKDLWLGECKKAYNVTAKDKDLLKYSTSGGAVTVIVKHLLKTKKFDKAFLVGTYNYGKAVNTEIFDYNSDLSNTPKSRYIPVMQTDAIKYLLNNKNEKIIFVGVPCFVQTLKRIISYYKLDKDNYFIIGLFCDKTMNYNVYDYFSEFLKGDLDKLFFRNKEAGGWPGDVTLEGNGASVNLPRFERMAIKDYFVPERCLYCVDKLNQFSDISVGDNYTGINALKEGSSSVLIRTEIGASVWKQAENLFDFYDISKEEIKKSQKLNAKERHLFYQKYKSSNDLILNAEFTADNLDDKYIKEYETALELSRLGANRRFDEIKSRVKKLRKKKKVDYYKKTIVNKFKKLFK